jgi:hypothetical protein
VGADTNATSQDDSQTAPKSRKNVRRSSATSARSKRGTQIERNRAANQAAAVRYRRKQKAAMDDLESKVKVLGQEKVSLKDVISTLEALLRCVKKEMSRHTDCGDEPLHGHSDYEGTNGGLIGVGA